LFCRHHRPEGLFADDGLPVGLDGAPAVAGGSRLVGGLDAQGARLRFGTRTRDGRWVLDLADGGGGTWPGRAPGPASHSSGGRHPRYPQPDLQPAPPWVQLAERDRTTVSYPGTSRGRLLVVTQLMTARSRSSRHAASAGAFREQVGGTWGVNRDVHRSLPEVCDGVAERAFEQVGGDLAGNLGAEQLHCDEVVGSDAPGGIRPVPRRRRTARKKSGASCRAVGAD
jgi:hypothetical protein